MEKYWYEPIRETIDETQEAIDEVKDAIKRQAGQKYLYEAKKVSYHEFVVAKWILG